MMTGLIHCLQPHPLHNSGPATASAAGLRSPNSSRNLSYKKGKWAEKKGGGKRGRNGRGIGEQEWQKRGEEIGDIIIKK